MSKIMPEILSGKIEIMTGMAENYFSYCQKSNYNYIQNYPGITIFSVEL